MKILKQGNYKISLYKVCVYTITCPKCGCIFEAQDTELHSEGGYSGCWCPCCHDRIYLENNYSASWKHLRREEINFYDPSKHISVTQPDEKIGPANLDLTQTDKSLQKYLSICCDVLCDKCKNYGTLVCRDCEYFDKFIDDTLS